MKQIQYIQYFKTHKHTYDEVVKLTESLKGDYENDSSGNLAKVVHNSLSKEAAEFYDVDFLNKCIKRGLHRLPIAVAVRDVEKMLQQAKMEWGRLNWIQKLVLGRKANDRSAATWLLASKFSRITPEFLSSLPEFDQEVVRFIYGHLLFTANSKQ
ncbi:hypothetical protein QTV49_001705 [Vibrio vulnificus]|nr:hypothetical protein [Vibrio vulnificus]